MPETVERLKRDENELVRQAANRAEKNRRKSPPSKQPRPVIDPNTLPNDPSIVPIPE
jgi:hypothetical protein